MATKVHYEFPRRGLLPEVDLHWYDGGLMPKRPEQLPDDVRCEAAARYIEAYEVISGKDFEPNTEDPIARLERNLGTKSAG